MDKLSRLDWSDLRVLLAIRDCGGASNAGDALGLSHQTVSRRLSRLEQALGLRLVNRERHPWVLTQRGESISAYGARMAAVARDVALYAQDEQPDRMRRISVACNAWGFDLLVLPVLADFSREHPGVRFDLVSGDTPLDVHGGRADIAIRFTDTPPPEALGRRIGRLTMGVWGTPDLITALEQGQIDQVTRVSLQGQALHGNLWPESAGDFPRFHEVSDFSALVAALRHGLGIAALPDIVGGYCKGLVRCQSVKLPTRRSVWILRNKDSRGSRIIRSVEEGILRHGKSVLKGAGGRSG